MYIVIIGCGRVGTELAKLLSLEGNDVVVIDKKDSSFSRLGDAFNGITIKGNGVSTKVLQDAGIERADVFCSLTNSDNINIMASQVAKGIFKVPRVIARVYDPRKASVYKTFGMDILSETTLFAAMIRDKIVEKLFSGYLLETGELGVMEFPVPGGVVGKSVEDVNVPGEFNITAIKRSEGRPMMPEPKTVITKNDVLIAVVKTSSLKKVKNLLGI